MDVVRCRWLLAAVLMLAHARAHAVPVLLEVYYDAPGNDAVGVFTEVAGAAGFSLDAWTLVGINGANGMPYRTIRLDGLLVPADGILVLATGAATGTTLAARDAVANVDWQNGPDAVALIDPAGMVVDALQYGARAGFSAGEGTPAPDVPAGSSLGRDHAAADSDDNAVDFRAGEPTPGSGLALAVNRQTSLPAPSTLLLVATAWALLTSRYRRRGHRQAVSGQEQGQANRLTAPVPHGRSSNSTAGPLPGRWTDTPVPRETRPRLQFATPPRG